MPARDRSRSRPFARKGVIGLADSRRPAAAFVAHHSPPPEKGGFFVASLDGWSVREDEPQKHKELEMEIQRMKPVHPLSRFRLKGSRLREISRSQTVGRFLVQSTLCACEVAFVLGASSLPACADAPGFQPSACYRAAALVLQASAFAVSPAGRA